ncbi:MAG TPA: ABC transporter permease, partial [Clostridiales bacterium]|nr:ABC transporter permease [Clostridiales bacterium]
MQAQDVRAFALKVLYPVLSIVIALIVTGFIIFFMGFNPLEAYAMMVSGSMKNLNAIGETVVSAVPLIFSALSFALAYKSGVFNIGVEGQIYIGALFTILVGTLKGIPPVIHMPLTIAAGFAGGALWGLLIGRLKVRFGANEMITTIMLNYVATIFISYCVAGPMKEKSGSGMSQTEAVVDGVRLPRFVPGTRLHAGI